MGTTLQDLFEQQKAKMQVLHELEYQIVYQGNMSNEIMEAYYIANQEARQAIADVIDEIKRLNGQVVAS